MQREGPVDQRIGWSFRLLGPTLVALAVLILLQSQARRSSIKQTDAGEGSKDARN
jgi:hypothetical protein